MGGHGGPFASWGLVPNIFPNRNPCSFVVRDIFKA